MSFALVRSSKGFFILKTLKEIKPFGNSRSIINEPKKEINMVILKIANMGEIKIELDYKNAPISSANFVSLVNKG